jgi:hypothetical protein
MVERHDPECAERVERSHLESTELVVAVPMAHEFGWTPRGVGLGRRNPRSRSAIWRPFLPTVRRSDRVTGAMLQHRARPGTAAAERQRACVLPDASLREDLTSPKASQPVHWLASPARLRQPRHQHGPRGARWITRRDHEISFLSPWGLERTGPAADLQEESENHPGWYGFFCAD